MITNVSTVDHEPQRQRYNKQDMNHACDNYIIKTVI